MSGLIDIPFADTIIAVFTIIINVFFQAISISIKAIENYLNFVNAHPVMNSIIIIIFFGLVLYVDVATTYAQPGILPTYGAEQLDVVGFIAGDSAINVIKSARVPVGTTSSFILVNVTGMNGTTALNAFCKYATEPEYLRFINNENRNFVWEYASDPVEQAVGQTVRYTQLTSPDEAGAVFSVCPWSSQIITYYPDGVSLSGLDGEELEAYRLTVMYESFGDDMCNDTTSMEAANASCYMFFNATTHQRISKTDFERNSFVELERYEYERGGLIPLLGNIHETIISVFDFFIGFAEPVPILGNYIVGFIDIFKGLYIAISTLIRMAFYGLYVGLTLLLGWSVYLGFIANRQTG